MLADFPRHAEVNIHTICGPWGGRDWRTKDQAGKSLFLSEKYIFQDVPEDSTHLV